MADEQGYDHSRSVPGRDSSPDGDAKPHGGHLARRKPSDEIDTARTGSPAELVRRADDTPRPVRVAGVRPGIVVALLVVIIVLATTVVVLLVTRPTSAETSTRPSGNPSATTTPSSTTASRPATLSGTRTSSSVPSPTSSAQVTTSAVLPAAPSWGGQVVLGSTGLSIATLPPRESEVRGDIAVGLMDEDTRTDTLALQNDTLAVRLDSTQNVSTAADCQQLIEHNRSGGRLQVHVGDRVCFQNQSGDVGLLTVKQRHPEGASFALRIDLQVWLHSS
jgi:hypothetical protein